MATLADIKEIKKMIKVKNIVIIEDAAQAHGAYDFNSKKLDQLVILHVLVFILEKI